MSAVTVATERPSAVGALWTRWLVVAVHVAFIVPAAIKAAGTGPFVAWRLSIAGVALTIALGLVLLALQLRLSFSFATGQRTKSAPFLFLAIAVLVYVPMIWMGWAWSWLEACLIASAPMVLRRGPALGLIAVILAGTGVMEMQVDGPAAGPALIVGTFWIVFTAVSWGVPAAGIYGSARLVRFVDALRDAQAELAAAAGDQERRRYARDLHDLLGQSLSAISLKGDLAIRLLGSDGSAARTEIESLTELARQAVRGVRAVNRDEHVVSLREETEGAVALLAAAGVKTHLDVDLSDLTRPQEALLAWAVREGVNNALRHSGASTLSIIAWKRGGRVVLEIVNDGVSGPTGEGSGLAGLAERARMQGGTVSAARTTEGGFRLVIDVPEKAA